MKRVTDRSDLASKQVPQYVSGCRQFEGEDLGKYLIDLTYHQWFVVIKILY